MLPGGASIDHNQRPASGRLQQSCETAELTLYLGVLTPDDVEALTPAMCANLSSHAKKSAAMVASLTTSCGARVAPLLHPLLEEDFIAAGRQHGTFLVSAGMAFGARALYRSPFRLKCCMHAAAHDATAQLICRSWICFTVVGYLSTCA